MSLHLNVRATNACFRGLRCAYTGVELDIRVVAAGARRPVYFAANAFDPGIPGDAAQVLETVRMRGGVRGAVPESALECAYTGAPLTPERTPAGFALTGGFGARSAFMDPEALAEALSMRGGRLPAGYVRGRRPDVTVSRREPAEEPPPAPPADDADATADRILFDAAPRPTKVTVPAAPAPKGRRKARG